MDLTKVLVSNPDFSIAIFSVFSFFTQKVVQKSIFFVKKWGWLRIFFKEIIDFVAPPAQAWKFGAQVRAALPHAGFFTSQGLTEQEDAMLLETILSHGFSVLASDTDPRLVFLPSNVLFLTFPFTPGTSLVPTCLKILFTLWRSTSTSCRVARLGVTSHSRPPCLILNLENIFLPKKTLWIFVGNNQETDVVHAVFFSSPVLSRYRTHEFFVGRCHALAERLWKKLEASFGRQDIVKTEEDGCLWKPKRINEIFKITKLLSGAPVLPPVPGPWANNLLERGEVHHLFPFPIFCATSVERTNSLTFSSRSCLPLCGLRFQFPFRFLAREKNPFFAFLLKILVCPWCARSFLQFCPKAVFRCHSSLFMPL